jgi:uncharacterized protein YecE (DUF72 family)
MSGRVRIGVSGWRYTPWRGNFDPKIKGSRYITHMLRLRNVQTALVNFMQKLGLPVPWHPGGGRTAPGDR